MTSSSSVALFALGISFDLLVACFLFGPKKLVIAIVLAIALFVAREAASPR